MLDIYACRSCDHTQYAKEKPDGCKKCGGVLSKIHGVQVVESEGDVNAISRQSGHDSDPEPFLSSRGYSD
jgi:hypothetical protein